MLTNVPTFFRNWVGSGAAGGAAAISCGGKAGVLSEKFAAACGGGAAAATCGGPAGV